MVAAAARKVPVSAIRAEPLSKLIRRPGAPWLNELRLLYTGDPKEEDSEGGGTDGYDRVVANGVASCICRRGDVDEGGVVA